MKEETQGNLHKQVSEAVLKGELPNEITIREGDALKLREPVKVNIEGTIDAPARWLEKRHGLDAQKCHVLVNRDKMSITLHCEENDHYGTLIEGQLTLSSEFRRFGINEGEYRTHFELAELIKMNRSYFESKSTAMKLVSELQNFKAKVEKEVEQSDNNRGDRRVLINQAVQHNLPEAFTLVLPIFKGVAEQTIQVEVYVNPADLTCTLISPEANDIIVSSRDALMDEVVKRIGNAYEGLVIIEQ